MRVEFRLGTGTGTGTERLNGTPMARLLISIEWYRSARLLGRVLTWAYTSERARGIEPS
jgi:hypothetical protein